MADETDKDAEKGEYVAGLDELHTADRGRDVWVVRRNGVYVCSAVENGDGEVIAKQIAHALNQLSSRPSDETLEIEQLREALRKYGAHLYSCTAQWCRECGYHVSNIKREETGCTVAHVPRACDCGLATLLLNEGEKK